MARDAGLEQMIAEDLADLHDLSTKGMFGGLAWMWRGHLLCGARADGMLARLGKGNDGWALALPTVTSLMSADRVMHGWVRLAAEATGDDALRQALLAAARRYVSDLPPKVAKPTKKG